MLDFENALRLQLVFSTYSTDAMLEMSDQDDQDDWPKCFCVFSGNSIFMRLRVMNLQ